MLYVVKSGDFVKVGYSSDVPKRMKQYATHNPNFELLYILAGDIKLEREIQKELDNYHFRLEWFHCDDYVLAKIAYLKEKFKDYVEDINSVQRKMRDIQTELVLEMFSTCKEVTNFSCSKHYKLIWANELGVALKSVDGAITKLKKKGILFDVMKGDRPIKGFVGINTDKLDSDIIERIS